MMSKHGGARKNAGRKPQGDAAKVTLTVTVSREVKEHLAATGNASREVERLVRKSKEFVK